MLYIFGVNIPEKKSVQIGLTYIKGIGSKQSKLICNKFGFTTNYKINNLTEIQIYKLINYIQKNFLIENHLKKDIQLNIERFIEIRSYKGKRHMYNLPVRGQRTHTNAQTSKKLNKTFRK